MTRKVRAAAKLDNYKSPTRTFKVPSDVNGNPLRVSEYFGENVFDYQKSDILTKQDKKDIQDIISKNKDLTKEMADKFANAVLNWAKAKGATHFTHWFQPLTGSTAEKHDAFFSIENGQPVERLSASQLIQGEPDASSFPHGGSRSTFEARGYTSWDFSSPIFLRSNENGKTLCIPTAFVSYHGEALDIKTPLLRSITQLSNIATKFCNLVDQSDKKEEVEFVEVTAGCEQEYFLVDKGLFFERPDLVMGGRTLFGAITSRNQQLEDHYFGTVPDRVMAFMQEVEVELYKLGVPAKTRHNEVAPGQFELAPIFSKANVAADQNQIIMATMQSVAIRHGFVCLLHEKPFGGINGSGKHLNWSMTDSRGKNLLEPTDNPHTNYRFLAVVAMICEAVNRHGANLRTAIAGHGNDHRLGANEAPPSIISIFLGDTLTAIFEAYSKGEAYSKEGEDFLDLRADQLARLVKDNTDRNRTSPFAFTGNKFEFRAVGSSANVGIPMTILNSAVADVMNDMNDRIAKEKNEGKAIDDILIGIIKDLYNNSSKVVFNGDGYSKEWEDEAAKRGLPNLRTTADALGVIADPKKNEFLTKLGIYTPAELETRYNVRVERYVKHRQIEFNTLINMVNKDILPAAIEYKKQLAESINIQKQVGVEAKVDLTILKNINERVETLRSDNEKLGSMLDSIGENEDVKAAEKIAKEMMPLSEKMADTIAYLEENVSEELWSLPTYYDMLFIR